MTIPNYVWFLVIPIFAGAIAPVIAQFYDTGVYFWSALLCAVLGAVVSAIAAVRQVQTPQPPPGAMSMGAPEVKQRGYLGRWFVGAK